MRPTIAVFSYYANMPGSCQAEWIDDRIFALIEKGYDIVVFSATCCFTYRSEHIRHYKISALSPHSAGFELEESKRRKISPPGFLQQTYLVGMASLDKVLKKLGISSGEGKWSWFFTSFFAGLSKMNQIRKADFIYSTGGPASAHLTGILLAKLLGRKIIAELQDPLSGKDIGRNKFSNKGLGIVENWIVRFADKTIYCTQNAMQYAREKYPIYAGNIFYVYPGAYPITNSDIHQNVLSGAPTEGNPKINITYLGSLYQTRNLDCIMQALQLMVSEGTPVEELPEIHLYGNMNTDIRERILQFPYPIIHIHGLVSRKEALQKAAIADVLLLIQNTDDRSIGTIPFKTYDYLHSGKRILALTYKNKELRDLLLEHGHLVCNADDVEAVKLQLRELIFSNMLQNTPVKSSKFTPQMAVESMINILRT